MTLTAELCERILAVTADSLDDATFEAGRKLVLDGVAVAVAGARTEHCIDIIADHLRSLESRPVASALGLGFALAPVPAALLNGTSMHVLDFEPMWKPSTHALSTTLPVVLALAEDQGADGREVVTALVKGIEIQGRLRQASKSLEPKDLQFHQPGMVGPLGAVVAAAHLLKLDKVGLASAIGIAASRCGGLIANIGTMTKSTHCGYAASLGLESALLAARGFTGNTDVFDHKQGYISAFFPRNFESAELLKFGAPFRVVAPGFALKAYPCKYQTHYTIICGIAARPRISNPDAVKAITITSPEWPAANRASPKTGMEGMFSMQFTLAAALLDGDVKIATFTDERLARADMQTLLPKISVTMDPNIPSNFEGRLVTVEIEMADGGTIIEQCRKPPGSWGATPLPESGYLAKIRECLATFLTIEDAEECIELGGRFETLGAGDVSRMMRLASGLPQLG